MATETETHDDEPAPVAGHDASDDGDGTTADTPGDGGDDGELHGLLAEFDTPGALIAAARKV